MEEKVSYQIGVNMVGINEYVDHFIPVENINDGGGVNEKIEDIDELE